MTRHRPPTLLTVNRVGGVGLRILQLNDVAVLRVPVVDALREEAEVAIATLELHLRRGHPRIRVDAPSFDCHRETGTDRNDANLNFTAIETAK